MATTQVNVTGAPQCWLDLLPSEIRKPIASRVCDPQCSNNGLHLAQTSKEQEGAVVDVLSNKVNLDAIAVQEYDEIVEWVNVLKGRVSNVELKNEISPSVDLRLIGRHLRHLLISPTLHRAEILYETSFITAISGLSSLRELKVIGMNGPPENAIYLLESLKTLDLFKLEFQCKTSSHFLCSLHGSRYWNDLLPALPGHCPNLHTFGMQVSPSPFRDDSNILWNTLPRLKALRHITIDQKPPPEALDTLRKLESVYIHDIPDGVFAAREIGRSVTGLKISSCLRGDHADVLSQFCRLKELDIRILPGTEHQLLASVQTMPELRSLSVKWEPARSSLFGEGFFGANLNENVQSGVLLGIVQCIPKLEKVEFLFFDINADELQGILMYLGKRLRHFGMSTVNRTFDGPYVKLEILFWSLYTYNPNIESVYIRAPGLQDPRSNSFRPRLFPPIIDEMKKRDMMMVLNRLQDRNPALDLCWDATSEICAI